MQSRNEIWAGLSEPWDVIVIGGGITGSGIMREAASRGLRCVLLEQRDFAWGTSSRSGKLVHGGLRYLKQGQIRTTWHSVTEREKLLRGYGGLVESLGFILPAYEGDRLGSWLLKAGLTIYDLMALRLTHRRYSYEDIKMLAPGLKSSSIKAGLGYYDAYTDDARLVLRVIQEGIRLGGTALNYAAVEDLCRKRAGRVCGVVVRDALTGHTKEVYGQIIINATGVWVDQLRSCLDAPTRMRPLRGSHLIFPYWRFPLAQAVGFSHPSDGRYVYAFPWEGVTLVGTTDVDHEASLDHEPRISRQEGNYLLEGVREIFPSYNLTTQDVLSTFSGVRPVVNTGKKDPSKESREHCIWSEQGLLTVTGGKLTTFGLLARETLTKAHKWVSSSGKPDNTNIIDQSMPDRSSAYYDLEEKSQRRLAGRYGHDMVGIINEADHCGTELIPGTETLWAELRWVARHERVVYLEDLLLRRVRLGILLPQGGFGILERLREEVSPLLGWDAKRWEDEVTRYKTLWNNAYSLEILTCNNYI